MAARSANLGSSDGTSDTPQNHLGGDGSGRMAGDGATNGRNGSTARRPRAAPKPRTKTDLPRNSVPMLSAFEAVADAMKEGLTPYGESGDPAWEQDEDAMGYICNRTADGIRARRPATIKLTPIAGGFQGAVIDVTLGYEVVFTFQHLHEWFTAFCEARHRIGSLKELTYGEGWAARKARRQKQFDDEVQGK
jgi:hypothetical protein